MSHSRTENGAISHDTTGSSVLNLFFKTVRDTPSDSVSTMMEQAWDEDPLLTLRAVFHLRDCRGGKGEKARFYDCMRWLVSNGHSSHVKANLEHVPFYGTYKDLFTFAGTDLENEMLELYAKTLRDDIDALTTAVVEGNLNAEGHANVTLTLAGKWAPTEGGSVDKRHHLARKITKLLSRQYAPSVGVSDLKDYRTRVLVPLRNHLDVVERYMCSMNWDEISFEHVPSVAMKNYRKAFQKHEQERFAKYLENVRAGKAKINSSQVYPHTLVAHYMNGGSYNETIELLWKDYVKSAREKYAGASAFPLVDVSGSMCGTPMEVAIALGLLLSEIASDQFRGLMMTFDANPSIFRVDVNASLRDKVAKVQSAPWGFNTNLARAFDLLLDTASMFNTPADKMPKTLYIFSDMQFDQASPDNSKTNFQNIELRYNQAGYTRPNVVFWNLRGDTVDFPVEQHVPRVALVSGFSPSLMELFLSGEVISPYAIMLKALSAPRYSKISLNSQ